MGLGRRRNVSDWLPKPKKLSKKQEEANAEIARLAVNLHREQQARELFGSGDTDRINRLQEEEW